MVCGENVGGSSQSGRIATTRHYLDRWWRLVTVCHFAMDLENIDYSVMVCDENVGGSHRSGRIVTDGDRLSVRHRLRKYSWLCYGVWWKCRWIVPIGTDRDDPSLVWRMVTFGDGLSVRDGLRKYWLRCYGVWWKCRRIVPIGTDRDDPSLPWRMVTFGDRLSVLHRVRKYSWRCYGGWRKCRRIVPIGTDRDDPSLPWRMVTVCQFAIYLKNNHGGVMYGGEDVGGSSRSGRIVSTRHSFDGWWRFVTICQFARDNSHDDVGQRLSCCHGGYLVRAGFFNVLRSLVVYLEWFQLKW